jgi:uroporphyrinogen III methyltransferase/synthase
VNAPLVWLVGAGPGDPGLITRRGLELIRSCEVLLYDRLVDPRLVAEASEAAERIFVGKRGGGPSRPQAEIDALIVDRAREGRRVVRLKGGDPFVFGRGADEAQALAAAGIAFEIVPGVTSAVAVPAYAGIPVTHSGASSSFAVVTAHESAARPEAAERWADVARGAGTLVLLMGVAGLEDTMKRVVDAGRDPAEPAAVVERGTTADQRTLVATAGTIAEAARAAGIESPAITIVGNVVRLRDALSWFETRPLFGRRVVVTRPHGPSTRLREALESAGAEVIEMPLIAIEPLDSHDHLDDALVQVRDGAFEWIAFSSSNAVDAVIDRAHAQRIDLGGVRTGAVGPRTAQTLRERGLEPSLVPERSTGEALAEALGAGPGRVLVPVPAERRSRVADELEGRGREVVRVPVYRTVPLEPDDALRTVIESNGYDALVFASGSAAEAFVSAFGAPQGLVPDADPQGSPKVIAIGPTTAGGLAGHGIRVDAVASEQTADGVVDAISKLLGHRS